MKSGPVLSLAGTCCRWSRRLPTNVAAVSFGQNDCGICSRAAIPVSLSVPFCTKAAMVLKDSASCPGIEAIAMIAARRTSGDSARASNGSTLGYAAERTEPSRTMGTDSSKSVSCAGLASASFQRPSIEPSAVMSAASAICRVRASCASETSFARASLLCESSCGLDCNRIGAKSRSVAAISPPFLSSSRSPAMSSVRGSV